MILSKRSVAQLAGVHLNLKAVVLRAADVTLQDFIVSEGLRSVEQQKKNMAAGVSKTMNSRHLPSKDGLARAVDLWAVVGGKVTWDMAAYRRIAAAMQQAATELNVTVEWGGAWKKLVDGPHFQLPWNTYP
jgi:peptidoglycan L-alanyl-D-glutamate endopeptidase CwlK